MQRRHDDVVRRRWPVDVVEVGGRLEVRILVKISLGSDKECERGQQVQV